MSDDLRNRGARAIANMREGGWPADTYALLQQHYLTMADAALAEMGEPAPSAREAAQLLLDEWRHGEGPLGELCCYSLGEDGTMQPDIDGRWVDFTKIEAALFRAIAEGKDDE